MSRPPFVLKPKTQKIKSDANSDIKTKLTASDAFYCKFSATEAGYCDHLVNKTFFSEMKRELEKPKSTSLPDSSLSYASRTQKRSPILHRGYVARMEGQHIIINKFLEAVKKNSSSLNQNPEKPQVQFLFLGCGFDILPVDSLYFNSNSFDLSVFEVDFPDVISHKYNCYKHSKALNTFLTGETAIDNFATPISSLSSNSTSVSYTLNKLKLLGHDLRREGLDEKLLQLGLSPNIPTLIFTECVLVYMDYETNISLCKQITKLFSKQNKEGSEDNSQSHVIWISYDMINPNDRYGQMMVTNLSQSGYALPGFIDFPTLESHIARYSEAVKRLRDGTGEEEGDNTWYVRNTTMLTFFNQILSQETRKRICSKELLDEIEEWNLIMSHYCLTISTLSSNSSNDFSKDLRGIVDELTTPVPI